MLSVADIETVMRRIYMNWDSPRYWELVEKFSLPNARPISTFSKGMKVKLNFAIALAHRSKLLLLDEATSNLDPVMRDDILDLLLGCCESGWLSPYCDTPFSWGKFPYHSHPRRVPYDAQKKSLERRTVPGFFSAAIDRCAIDKREHVLYNQNLKVRHFCFCVLLTKKMQLEIYKTLQNINPIVCDVSVGLITEAPS